MVKNSFKVTLRVENSLVGLPEVLGKIWAKLEELDVTQANAKIEVLEIRENESLEDPSENEKEWIIEVSDVYEDVFELAIVSTGFCFYGDYEI